MQKVKTIEKEIFKIEGFNVNFKHPDGRNVRDDFRIAIPYDNYERQAKNSYTVAEWKRKRFNTTYSNFKVDILFANGDTADGRCKLSRVRDTYLEEDSVDCETKELVLK